MSTTEEKKNYRVSYARNWEDLTILSIFGEGYQGFYIDVGSRHPIHHSVTKLLYRQGWRGLNIEPNSYYRQLTDYDRPNDTQLPYGLDVETRTLKGVCEEHGVETISLLKLSAKGSEYNILSGNDWEKYRPKVVYVEGRTDSNLWSELLVSKGYQKLLSDSYSDYYVDTSCELYGHQPDYYATVLKYPHLVDNEVAGYVGVLEKRLKTASYRPSKADASHEPTMSSLKANVRNTLHELKHLAKQRRLADIAHFVPEHIPSRPEDLKDLASYVEGMNNLYRRSVERHRTAMSQRSRTTRAGRLANKARIVAIDAPLVLLSGVGATIQKRRKS
jgi:hypothetical protein